MGESNSLIKVHQQCKKTLPTMRLLKLLGFSVYGGCVYHVINSYYITLVRCEEKSMYPTINKTSANDCVLTEIWSKRRGLLKKNDIIVFRQPDQPDVYLCKRIKYIEGETIPDTSIRMTTPPTLSIIPRGHIWVEGDNSSVSHDSRYFGPVPLALVHSKLFLRVWPPSQFGWIK